MKIIKSSKKISRPTKRQVTSSVSVDDILDELYEAGYDIYDADTRSYAKYAAESASHEAPGYTAHMWYTDTLQNYPEDLEALPLVASHRIRASEDDLEHPDQEYDSAATSINSNKLPAIYRMVSFNPGDCVIDFGGGRFDNAINYLKDKDVTLCVYDPYNRSAEHNAEMLRIIKENGGADAAVNSNVLNVIKEDNARLAVLRNIKKLLKPSAPVYITVYEGRGDGVGGETKSGYQLNRKTQDYLEEVQKVFPDAVRKGKLIKATNSGGVSASRKFIRSPKSVITAATKYDDYMVVNGPDGADYAMHYNAVNFVDGDDDVEAFRNFKAQIRPIHPYDDGDYAFAHIENGTIKYVRNRKVIDTTYLMNPDDEDFAYEDEKYPKSIVNEALLGLDEINKDVEQRIIHNSTDIMSAKATPNGAALHGELLERLTQVMTSPSFGFESNDEGHYWDVDVYPSSDTDAIVVEVRAEVDYDGLERIMTELDPIVQSYDPNSYLEPEQPGVLTAYLDSNAVESIQSNQEITGAYDDIFNPPDTPEYVDEPDTQDEIELELKDVQLTVNPDSTWELLTNEWSSNIENPSGDWIDEDGVYLDDATGVEEKAYDLLEPYIPGDAGTYILNCLIYLTYNVSGLQVIKDPEADQYAYYSRADSLVTDDAKVSWNRSGSYVTNLHVTK